MGLMNGDSGDRNSNPSSVTSFVTLGKPCHFPRSKVCLFFKWGRSKGEIGGCMAGFVKLIFSVSLAAPNIWNPTRFSLSVDFLVSWLLIALRS